MLGTCAACELEDVYCEGHHIIYKSQCKCMIPIKINIALLCVGCHRSSPNGVHHNKKLDLRLKKNLQFKLETMFIEKDYYTEDEIKYILKCSKDEVFNICKKLCFHIRGYDKDDLIMRMLGGRFYI